MISRACGNPVSNALPTASLDQILRQIHVWLKVNSTFSHLSLSVDSNNTGSCIMWCRDKDGISTDSVHVDTGG